MKEHITILKEDTDSAGLYLYKSKHPIQENTYWYVGKNANRNFVTWISGTDGLFKYHWDILNLEYSGFDELP